MARLNRLVLLVLFLATLTLLAGRISMVSGASLVVNDTGDSPDSSPGDGICQTSPGSGICTLRAAIEEANALPGADAIQFQIGTGPQTITPHSSLPAITSPVTIDATTQPGFTTAPIIELNGAASYAFGIKALGGSTVIRGLVVNRFNVAQIDLEGAGGDSIAGNYVGIDSSGSTALGGGDGVRILGASNNTIGGAAAGDRNVVSGNGLFGIQMYSTSGNVIQGNFVGTNAAGTVAVRNSLDGIIIVGDNNTVGGPNAGARNVISGNYNAGVFIAGSSNIIAGNLIGTDVAGTSAIPNGGGGIFVNGGTATRIGGTSVVDRNVISGNSNGGIKMYNSGGNVVQGNFIGTDITGGNMLSNFEDGISISGANNLIGGTGPGAGNVISGSYHHGIDIFGSDFATGNVIQGNMVGTDVTGTHPLGNGAAGIQSNGPETTIGGPTPGAGNLVSANDQGIIVGANSIVQGNLVGTDASGMVGMGNRAYGLFVGGPQSTIGGSDSGSRNVISANGNGIYVIGEGGDTRIEGNLIGVKADGVSPLGNKQDGIFAYYSPMTRNYRIGGTGLGEGNTIAYNGRAGVYIDDGTDISIRGNSVFSNGTLGIDLVPAGVTPNDQSDSDAGPNNLQNFPTILSVDANTGEVSGTLDSTPNATFLVDVYASSSCDPTGFGEGERYQTTTPVTTDSSGNATFVVSVPPQALGRPEVTATATDTSGNTSEFSACRLAIAQGPADGPAVGGRVALVVDTSATADATERTRWAIALALSIIAVASAGIGAVAVHRGLKRRRR